jgi:hypothetical protein
MYVRVPIRHVNFFSQLAKRDQEGKIIRSGEKRDEALEKLLGIHIRLAMDVRCSA